MNNGAVVEPETISSSLQKIIISQGIFVQPFGMEGVVKQLVESTPVATAVVMVGTEASKVNIISSQVHFVC